LKDLRYRIGLIVDGARVPKWVRDLADWADRHPDFELAALIIGPPPSNRGLLGALLAAERLLLRFSADYRPLARLYPVSGLTPVELRGVRRGGQRSVRLAKADRARLEQLGLDILVQCGCAAPAPDLVAAARDGFLFLSAGSGGAAADGARGFAEVLDGLPETRFAIERFAPSANGPETLFTGSISTALGYASTTAALHARAFGYIRLVLERLAAGTAEPGRHDRGLAVPRRVAAGDVAAYAIRTAKRGAGKLARRFLGREFNWSVGFTRQSWSDGDWAAGTAIANPGSAFLADPFTIAEGGAHYVLVEEFPFRTRKGVISAYAVEGNAARRIGPVLERPYHLSFPFLFRFGPDIFMVPESGADRSVRLYRSTSFPGGWEEVRILLSGVAAVDTILFEHRGLWWMLTTIKGEGPALNNAELHAFHAPDPLGEWTPHRNNPVVMDARRGRSGGFLRDADGRPHRVAQVPGFTFYGAGAAIYRIDELSPDSYSERLVREIGPGFQPGLDGTHHIHSADGLTVYDFMRVERPARRRTKR
jgi:hypothetical protein